MLNNNFDFSRLNASLKKFHWIDYDKIRKSNFSNVL